MNWIFGFFGNTKSTEHPPMHHKDIASPNACSTPINTKLEIDYDKLANAIVCAHHRISAEEEVKRQEEINEWYQRIGYVVPNDKVFPQGVLTRLRNYLVVPFKSLTVQKQDIKSHFVVWNDAKYVLLRHLRFRKWMWFFAGFNLFVSGCASLKLSTFLLGLLFAMLMVFRGNISRIAMFEIDNIHNHDEIGVLLSLYTSRFDSLLSIIAIIISVASWFFHDMTLTDIFDIVLCYINQ